MKDEIFGSPKFEADEYGVSHLTYNVKQGIERIVRGVGAAIERLSGMSLMWMPEPVPIGYRNRPEWSIGEYRVGHTYDEDSGEKVGGFIVRIEVRDFGSECPPPLGPFGLKTLPDRILHVLRVIAPLERMIMLSCYTPEGFYIGDLDTAITVYGAWGLTDVQPFRVALGTQCAFDAITNKNSCSVGFDRRKQEWVGWSHRAAASYGIGYVAQEGNCETSSGWSEEYLKEHPEDDISIPVGFEVKTLDDAKRCACAFAESVS